MTMRASANDGTVEVTAYDQHVGWMRDGERNLEQLRHHRKFVAERVESAASELHAVDQAIADIERLFARPDPFARPESE